MEGEFKIYSRPDKRYIARKTLATIEDSMDRIVALICDTKMILSISAILGESSLIQAFDDTHAMTLLTSKQYFPVSSRDFVTLRVVRKISEMQTIVLFFPAPAEFFPPRKNYVRGFIDVIYWNIKQVAPNHLEVAYISKIDLNINFLPNYILNMVAGTTGEIPLLVKRTLKEQPAPK